jgi:hypothetical protein
MPVSTVTSRLWQRRVVELDSEARVGKDPQQCQWLSSAGCKSLHTAITRATAFVSRSLVCSWTLRLASNSFELVGGPDDS